MAQNSSQNFHPRDSTAQQLPTNYTIVLGALSAGSIPQISLHLLLSSLAGFEYFGSYFDPSSQQPTITTFDPTVPQILQQSFNSSQNDQIISPNQVHYGIELYINHTCQLIVITQHATALPHRKKAFSTLFFNFLTTFQPKLIINLASLPSSHRPAENKDQIQWFIVNPDQLPSISSNLANVISTPIQPLQSMTTYDPKQTMDDNDIPEDNTITPLPHNALSPASSVAHATPTNESTPTHANILQNILHLPPTSLTDDEIEAQKQYLRIKYTKPMLSVEGFLLALPTSSTSETPLTPTKQIKDLDFMEQFPYPIKGGGHSRALAKFVRKQPSLHLTTLITFPGPQSSTHLTQMLLEYLMRVTETFGNEFKTPQIVGYDLDLY